MTPVPDPFPALAEIREDGGVAEVIPNFWLVARYDLVREGFKDSTCLSNRAPHGRESDSIVHLDGEPHRKLRKLLSRAFTPRAMRGTEGIVAAIANDLIDDLGDAGRTNFVDAFTRPLPTIVMSAILGVPAQDRADFVRWSDEAVAHAYLPEPAPSADEFEAYVLGRIEEARSSEGETLIHYLVDERDGEGRLTDRELLHNVRILIIAGNETTANLLGTTFFQLLSVPERWERVVADASLVEHVIEESLRFDPPLNWVPREAASSCPVGEVTIPQDAHVGLGVGAANRDPAVFESPDDYDIDRHGIRNTHLTFGYGEHFCLGATLARVEAQTALEVARTRLPNLALDPDFQFAPKGPIMMRGVSELPVSFSPAKARE